MHPQRTPCRAGCRGLCALSRGGPRARSRGQPAGGADGRFPAPRGAAPQESQDSTCPSAGKEKTFPATESRCANTSLGDRRLYFLAVGSSAVRHPRD